MPSSNGQSETRCDPNSLGRDGGEKAQGFVDDAFDDRQGLDRLEIGQVRDRR